MKNPPQNRVPCPRCKRVIKLGKDCPYCGLWAFFIEKSLESHPLELHQDTVKRLLTNLIINTDDDAPDETAEKIAEILADQMFLDPKEATNLVSEIIDETKQQIIEEYVDIDGSHTYDAEEAIEKCFTSNIDTLIENILQGLENKGKIIFKGRPIRPIIMKPEKPLQNIVKLDNLFGSFSGKIWWWDKYFDKKGFYRLTELDEKKIKDVKICMGPTHVNEKFKHYSKSTKTELEMKGINFDLRVLVDKEALKKIHARIIIDNKNAYSLSSTPTIVETFDYVNPLEREAAEEAKRKFDELWGRAVDIIKSWEDIQKARDHKSNPS